MNGVVLTVPETATELRCSERFVLDELRRKNLRGSKTGAGWRIDPADIRTYLDAHANVTRVRRAEAGSTTLAMLAFAVLILTAIACAALAMSPLALLNLALS